VQEFPLLHSAHSDSDTQAASYPVGAKTLSTGVNRLERETDHSPPFNVEVKKDGGVSLLHHMCSWHNNLLSTGEKLHYPVLYVLVQNRLALQARS
jgi:hypothetical protein